jgi:CheY-like chemotaxis protein
VVDDEWHGRDRLLTLLSGEPKVEWTTRVDLRPLGAAGASRAEPQRTRVESGPLLVTPLAPTRVTRAYREPMAVSVASHQIVGDCANGLEALEAISTLEPDAVFLDVEMPDLDGLGVLNALGDGDGPEIVFVTAHSEYIERAFELHAVDYLRKPFTNARFSSALLHARRRVESRRQERSQPGPAASQCSTAMPRPGTSFVARTSANRGSSRGWGHGCGDDRREADRRRAARVRHERWARAGAGLTISRRRLQELYGERRSLRLTNGPKGGAEVHICLPFE